MLQIYCYNKQHKQLCIEGPIDNKKYKIMINSMATIKMWIQLSIHAVESAGSVCNNRFVFVILEYKP